jgi:signal transduction histidine kinase
MSVDDIVERLAALPLLESVPREQIEWLAAHGELRTYASGTLLRKAGARIDEMSILLAGHVAWYIEKRGASRKGGEMGVGKIVGPIPYSRFDKAPANLVVEDDLAIFDLSRTDFPGLIADCPDLTAALVHHMIDRSRDIRAAELNDDRLQSIGRIASGLAHELNNPASAATRHAQSIAALLTEAEDAARRLAAARLSDEQLAAVDAVRTICERSLPTRTALEAADREDDVSEWLMRHGVDPVVAEPLASSDVSLETLDRLAGVIPPDTVGVVLRWVASGVAARRAAREIASATGRIHDLIGAVKGFTFMDREAVPEEVNVARGLADTLTVLESKIRSRSVTTRIETAADLPHVYGFGSELNQVWQNLIDNAIDAAGTAGHVTITATSRGDAIVVRVADDGPGIPEEHRARIFDPFFTTKPVGQGTGLGLDLVRRIVHLHNGDVDFTSQPGRTAFRVRLPVTGARAVPGTVQVSAQER